LALLVLVPVVATPAGPEAHSRVRTLRILILSTMLADEGIGEWGFSALVEADGQKILFDTGARPQTVLQNARELKADLAGVRDVVLSHHHDDHTGGLLALRKDLAAAHPGALARVHVGRGIFLSRPAPDGGENNSMIALRPAFEATGGTFIEHDSPVALWPGVWLTGPVPRVQPERNYGPPSRVRSPEGLVEDTIPEYQSLVFDTDRGLVLLSGCGHAGVINTVEYARKVVRPAPLHAAIGGFHLLRLADEQLDWTADHLREAGLENFIGAHCTGIEAVYRMRARMGLARGRAVVGAVGASFELGKGIDPLALAR
ncbi:MAG TPA: MBL fold metallo-hydrolase, partial [Vicinamibacteria bacterium]|nr:MBL fold metallo-hydrolase [Vicinamibacteria bacterium]